MFFQPYTYYAVVANGPSKVKAHGKNKAVDWSKEWPETTDCLCWNCAHPFGGKPLPLPTAYDSRLDTFQVSGIFCSWNCVKAFSRDCRPLNIRGVDSHVFTLFYKRCTGKIDSISAAPPRIMLHAFGGHMDIEEYRDKGKKSVRYDIFPPKMILRSQVVHEHRMEEQRERRVEDLTTVVDMSSTSAALSATPKTNELKLKRPKPVNARKQSLFEKIVVATESVGKRA